MVPQDTQETPPNSHQGETIADLAGFFVKWIVANLVDIGEALVDYGSLGPVCRLRKVPPPLTLTTRAFYDLFNLSLTHPSPKPRSAGRKESGKKVREKRFTQRYVNPPTICNIAAE